MSGSERRALIVPAWSRCASMVALAMLTVIANQATSAIKDGVAVLSGWEWTLFVCNTAAAGIVAWRAWVDKTSARLEQRLNGKVES